MKTGNQLVTDLYVKPIDIYQYIHASLCHVFHRKKPIPSSQAFRFNRICSENAFFDKRFNELQVCLKERGYNENLERGQILKARKYLRSEVLNKQKRVGNKSSFVFNITCHPVFSKLENVLSEIYLLFRRAKSLKDIFVRAKVAPLEKKKGCCGSCGGTRCEIYNHFVTTKTFGSLSTQRENCIKPDNLNCRSSDVVYLFSCKACLK